MAASRSDAALESQNALAVVDQHLARGGRSEALGQHTAGIPDDMQVAVGDRAVPEVRLRPVDSDLRRLNEHDLELEPVSFAECQAGQLGQAGPRAGATRMQEHQQRRLRRIPRERNLVRPVLRGLARCPRLRIVIGQQQ